MIRDPHEELALYHRATAHERKVANMTDELWEQILQRAEVVGAEDGKNAAGWFEQDSFGGRVANAADAIKTARRILQGIEDGDPEVMDTLPFADFSGQWADGPDPREVTRQIVAEVLPEDVDLDDYLADDQFGMDLETEVINAYSDAFSLAAQTEVERMAREVVAAADAEIEVAE